MPHLTLKKTSRHESSPVECMVGNKDTESRNGEDEEQGDIGSLTEDDANSLSELIKFEPAERPPSLVLLRQITHHRFSDGWIKYMYAKFKNECPCGRMKLPDFKRLFGVYVPDRISDAYLERMFNAFCYASPNSDQLTFKDLMECLSVICDEDPHANAEWTIRLINNGQQRPTANANQQQVHFTEFNEFVKSIFLLVGREQRRRKQRADSVYVSEELRRQEHSCGGGSGDANNPLLRILPIARVNSNKAVAPIGTLTLAGDQATTDAIRQRALIIFKELDTEGQGYLTIDSLEKAFIQKEPKQFIFWGAT